MTDIQIAQNTKMDNIINILNKLNIKEEDYELYGKYKAKINYNAFGKKNGNLILVTAINPTLLGAQDDFTMTVNEVRLSAGAGFIVVICGKIMTMPGLPKVPAANNIGLDENDNIIGLF